MKPIRVLIVDDSAVVRQVMGSLFEQERDFIVMPPAADPLIAIERMRQAWPDVIVLDMEMPRMDGLSFLRKLMAERPTPVVVCSTLTEAGTRTALDALAAGAVSTIAKAKLELRDFLQSNARELVSTVREAARAQVRRITASAPMPAVVPKHTADVMLAPAAGPRLRRSMEQVVAIGTSTGGPQALEAVLTELPYDCPGIVIVQHMPGQFTTAFASRLDNLCRIRVKEASTGNRVMRGQALIAPGGRHLMLRSVYTHYQVEVMDGPAVNRHRPSVDVLFRSVAKAAGASALGIIMTGMGDDGAQGLLEMRHAGACTVGQDEASCVVYGMPKEAHKRGAVERSVTLSQIAPEIMQFQRLS